MNDKNEIEKIHDIRFTRKKRTTMKDIHGRVSLRLCATKTLKEIHDRRSLRSPREKKHDKRTTG